MSEKSIYLRNDYVSRINKVLDFIDENLDKELSLKSVAEVANFSPYHFHRLFSAIVRESLNQYIKRVRVQRAASILSSSMNKSITEIAFDCGFSGSATFARAFKDYFNMSASEWRNGGCLTYEKEHKNNGMNRKASLANARYECQTKSDKNRNLFWEVSGTGGNSIKSEVRIEELPDMEVAYIRHIGPYQGDGELFGRLFGALFRWAGPRGLFNNPDFLCMSMYYDNPDLTDDEKLRLNVCMTVPPDTAVDGEIGKLSIKGGTYALARFEIDTDQYGDAWDAVFAGWFPVSGYQPVDQPCMEIYRNDPTGHPEHKHIVDICIPVVPV